MIIESIVSLKKVAPGHLSCEVKLLRPRGLDDRPGKSRYVRVLLF